MKSFLKLYLCLLIFRAPFLIGSYFYYQGVFSSADFIWFWIVWGMIDFPIVFLYPAFNSIFTALMLPNALFNPLVLLLHLLIGTLIWSIVLFFLWKILKKLGCFFVSSRA